ncbi:MAG TPA: hypothetical protein VNZ55_12295 [Thermomicrobiales bacterium]|nr:hypothetical protein [Thermomicrobiales bacterium]
MIDQERVARAGYEAWRRTSPDPRPPWEYLRDHEREPWRNAASGGYVTGQQVWRRRYAGYYLPTWGSLTPAARDRWERIAMAINWSRSMQTKRAA